MPIGSGEMSFLPAGGVSAYLEVSNTPLQHLRASGWDLRALERIDERGTAEKATQVREGSNLKNKGL